MLSREGLPPDERLAASLCAWDLDFEQGEFVGQVDLMRDQGACRYPGESFERVARWVCGAGICPVTVEPHKAEVGIPDPDLDETAIMLGPDPGIFSILCRPLIGGVGATAVVFLNNGVESHIGPNRLWVSTSRLLARHGVAALRLDVGGVGVSPGRDADFARTVEAGPSDIRTAIDALEAQGASRIVLVGYCLGAVLAWRVAQSDARVAGQVLINPWRNFWRDEGEFDFSRRATTTYLRLAVSPAAWMRLLKGGISPARLGRAATSLVGGLAQRTRRLFSERAPEIAIEATPIDDLVVRRLRTMIIFGEQDPLFQEFRDQFALGPSQTMDCLDARLEVVVGMAHTFPHRRDRDRIFGLLVAQVEQIASSERAKPSTVPALQSE